MLPVITIVLVTLHSTYSVEHCQTPNGQDGDCKPINQCQPIFSLFQHRPFSNTTATFLRRSVCGLVGVYPKVCCPIGSPVPPKPAPETPGHPLLPKVCGNGIQNKILGGDVAGLDEFPWMALLEYEVPGRNRSYGCGGSLINKRYVVTARHCIKPNLVAVRLGEYNTKTNPDCIESFFGEDCAFEVLTVPVEEKISYSGKGDLALLRLGQDVEFNDFVKPICLPFAVDELINYGEKLIVSGWGLTEKKRSSEIKLKVEVPIKSLSDCEIAFKDIFNANVALNDGQICAGGEEGKDSCNGDSGGPLMGIKVDKRKNPQWYLMGIVSFGPTNPCGRKNKPAVYVKVSKYIDWIVNNLKS